MKITVIAHPNAKRPRIEEDLFGTLHVYVNAPALEGKANRAVIKALADYLKVKTNRILFVSGNKSKQKIFEIMEDR